MEQNTIMDKKNLRDSFLVKYATIGALILVFIIFALISDRFLAKENLLNIIKQTSLLIIVALGVTIAMSAGEFDLSTGNVVCVGTILSAALMTKAGWGVVPTLIFVIFIGILIGAINAFFVVVVGIPSMIVTLGMSNLLAGVASSITKGKSIYGAGIPDTLTDFASGSIGPISNLSIIGLFFMIIVYLFLNKTLAGRYIYAVGGNSKAAKLSGINVFGWRFLSLTLCSTFCIIAGVLLMARLGTGSATAGVGYTLDALSAVFIGMTCIRVGRPNVVGTLVGAFLIAILTNGLNMMGVTYYYQDMVSGAVMIIAIALTASKKELKF